MSNAFLGAIVGDIVGSRFEFKNCKSKDFKLFTEFCFPTDDSIMTISIMDAVMKSKNDEELKENAVKSMRKIGQNYPNCGYGGRFANWMYAENPEPYNSYGNGAAMRVSPVAYIDTDLNGVISAAYAVTGVTHNHPEGMRGAAIVAACIWAARHMWTKEEIRDYVNKNYRPINFTLDQIRDVYRFNETCQGTVQPAIEAFLESTDFEDSIRNAISIGGDSDTIAAITGSIAGAYYGVPDVIAYRAMSFLDDRLRSIVKRFALYVNE